MSNPIESEHQPRSKTPSAFSRIITSWRTWTTLAFAFAGGTGAKIAADKWAEERAKSPQGETKDIDGGIMPSAQAFEDPDGAFILTPTLIPTATPTRIPAKPTAEPVTPAATATSKPAETPPTPTIGPLKPSHEQTFSTGAVEKYDMVTEKNFDKMFEKEPKEQFQQRVKSQSSPLLFPYSAKGEFSMSEFTGSSGYNTLQIYSSDCDVYAPIEGTVRLNITKQYSTIEITSSEKAADGSYLVVTFSANNPQLELAVAQGDQAKKSNKLFHFSGSDPVAYNPSKYTAEKNQLSFKVERRTDLNPPIVTILPGGGKMTKKMDVKVITPSLQDLDEWETKKEKVVVIE